MCQTAKSFNEEIKKNAIDSMFSINSLPDSLLIRTIQKESLDGYQAKVFNFIEKITHELLKIENSRKMKKKSNQMILIYLI